MKFLYGKKGVSLVTVLLFMLVATIAATATYKWLTSEGRSSASRLKQSEAYQSALAGLESARSWMTFHANDVGSLIKQYKTGGNNPIPLTGTLKELARANQNYRVWLVGVNTSQSTYKLKILSSGTSANGSVYNLVGIFNVDGLYQVKIPQQKVLADIDYDFAYFGGSYKGAGNVTLTSGLVNGNWKGNPQGVDSNFIVTGNVELDGNNANVGKLACVGGDLNVDNQGLTGKNLYVGGNSINSRMTISEDAYFNGSVIQSNTGGIKIDGSVTLNGFFKANQSGGDYTVDIGENLCVHKDGRLVSGGTNAAITVTGNVWMPGDRNIGYGNIAETDCQCRIESCTCEIQRCGCEQLKCGNNPDNNNAWECTVEEIVPCAQVKQDATYQRGAETCEITGTQSCAATFPEGTSPGKRTCTIEGTQSCSSPAPEGMILESIGCSYGAQETANDPSKYDKIILGNKTDSKVYIKTAKAASTYAAMVNKVYKENGADKRDCPEKRFTFNTRGGNWTRQYGETHYSLKDRDDEYEYVCGELGSETSYTHGYGYGAVEVVDYTKGWNNWETADASGIFPSVDTKDDMYYLYDLAGTRDIRYEAKDIPRWRVYSKPTGSPAQQDAENSRLVKYIPINQNALVNFDKHFEGHAKVAEYYIGDKMYYDPTEDVNNFYNYENGRLTGSPYCYDGGGDMGKYRPTCAVSPWFQSKGTVSQTLPAKRPFDCADSVEIKCMEYLGEKTQGCDGSSYKVADILVTGIKKFEDYAGYGCAATITKWESGLVTKLNNCWSQLHGDDQKKKDSLYNEFLVVHVSGGSSEDKCPSGTLDGKFVIIADDPIECQNGLPATGIDDYVFLYLKNGAKRIGGSNNKNYFIYSENQIGSVLNMKLSGSIYLTAESCAGMGDMQSSTLNYDALVVSEMTTAGIICNAKVGKDNCGGVNDPEVTPGSSSSGSGESEWVVVNSTDDYYVSNATTLSISLESQYKSNEAPPEDGAVTDLSEDFVVVPRIVYLTQDPYGELADYYNVLGLNGMAIQKSAGTVACGASGIPVSGKLYDRTGSPTKLATGLHTCTFTYEGKSVPFYVSVQGESGTTPSIHFTESSANLGPSGTYDVKIYVPAHAQSITVTIEKPSDIDKWTIQPLTPGTCSGNTCTFTFPGAPTAENKSVFRVTTDEATTGTALFQLHTGEGYTIMTPSSITLGVNASVYVVREDATTAELRDFCDNQTNCPSDLVAWPNCSTNEEWVKATGQDCHFSTINSSWVCGVGGDISFSAQNPIDGCFTIIPSGGYSSENLVPTETYKLHASLKARPMTFKFGYAEGDHPNMIINAKVTYSSQADRVDVIESCSEGVCTMTVFKGERVQVYFNSTTPEEFNYWECTGTDCPETINSGNVYSSFSVNHGDNKVLAHFGEDDRHCFFDEFKTGVDCDDRYCIGASGTKWRTTGSDKLDYRDGYVSVKSNKSDKTGVMVMSTAVAGSRGTLKAQFQVARAATGSSDLLNASVANTGFILHSDVTGSHYLLLNVYANNHGYLVARLCNEDASVCRESEFKKDGSKMEVSFATVVTLTVDVSTALLNVSAVTSRFGASQSYQASFDFDDDFVEYRSGQYVGFRIADPSFKLYDIGWKSEDYGSTCWDTYPTVNCSFKSAYAGGMVPMNTDVTPWVGLSSWFDKRDCEPHYFYKGSDNILCGSESAYEECSSGSYKFSLRGAHGYVENGVEKLSAKAGVGNCYNLGDEKDKLLAETEQAHCGAFWVGNGTPCSKHIYFAGPNSPNSTYSGIIASGSQYNFALDNGVYANVRQSKLRVELENEDNSLVEIYLISRQDAYSNVFHSRSYETTSTGVLTIDIDSLSESDGFDPQSVTGVMVSVLGSSGITVKAIKTECPNVVSLECNDDLTYDVSTAEWTFSVKVKNYGYAKSFAITEESNYVNNKTYDCQNNECLGNSIDSRTAEYTFALKDAPYISNAGKDYAFNVTLEVADGSAPLTCTSTGKVTAITADCSGGLSKTSVEVGKYIPSLTYSISGCPEKTGCPYTISLLTESGTVEKDAMEEGNGNVTDQATSPLDANTEREPLTEGAKYKIRVESTRDSMPFMCISGLFEVAEPEPDHSASCSNPSFDGTNFSASIEMSGTYWNGMILVFDHLGHLLEGNPALEITSSTSTSLDESLGTKVSNLPKGKYKITLDIEGDGSTDCTAEYTRVDWEDKITCPASPSDSIVEKTQVTVSPTINDNACSGGCTYSVNKGSNEIVPSTTLSGDVSFTDNASEGKTQVAYSIEIVNTANTNQKKSCPINVKYKNAAPSFAVVCGTGSNPDVIAGKTDVESGSTIDDIAPYNVSGCGNSDCSYLLAMQGGTITSGGSMSNYGGGTIAFSGADAPGQTKHYTLTIYSPNSSSSHACTFDVTYASSSSGEDEGCHCETYCGTGCEDNIITGNQEGHSLNGCYFFTEATQIAVGENNGDPNKWKINNKKPSNRILCWNGSSECETALSSYTKADDGYYINADNVSWVQFKASADYNPCRLEVKPVLTTCDVASTSVYTNTEVVVTPTLSTSCETKNGCTYTISDGVHSISDAYHSGTIRFIDTHASDGDKKTYTLVISNGKGNSSACTMDEITYSTPPVCQCKCASGCSDVITTGWNNGAAGKQKCYFTQNPGSYLGPWDTNCVTVYGAGTTKVKKCGNYYSWNGNFDGLATVDGGYYIQFEGDNVAADFGAGTRACRVQ